MGIDTALIASAALIGLAGAPHCTAMCGAPCVALSRRGGAAGARGALAGLLAGRWLSYMSGGALAAAGVALFAALANAAPVLRPLWGAAQAAALGFGVWLLITGRMPAWLGGAGRVTPLCVDPRPRSTASAPRGGEQLSSERPGDSCSPAGHVGWKPVVWRSSQLGALRLDPAGSVPAVAHRMRVPGSLRAAAAGTLWLALPCGLLQSALIVAALASTPWQGAAAMSAFAATSSLGLVVYPALLARLTHRPHAMLSGAWAIRASGAALVAASAWGLGHGLWQRLGALCAGALPAF